jgi:hypothetical protein
LFLKTGILFNLFITSQVDECIIPVSLFKKFNKEFTNTLLVMGDEVGNRGSMYKNSDKMKTLITRTTQNIEGKGVDVEGNMPDYNDYILFTNNDYIAKAEASDRRLCCMNASNKRVGDLPFWKTVNDKEMNMESGKHMFHYLTQMDLKDYDPRKIPMTVWKRELMDNGIDPKIRCILNVIGNKYPTEYQYCKELIEDIAYSRIFLGHHYPSDNDGGREIGKAILKHPEFTKKYGI